MLAHSNTALRGTNVNIIHSFYSSDHQGSRAETASKCQNPWQLGTKVIQTEEKAIVAKPSQQIALLMRGWEKNSDHICNCFLILFLFSVFHSFNKIPFLCSLNIPIILHKTFLVVPLDFTIHIYSKLSPSSSNTIILHGQCRCVPNFLHNPSLLLILKFLVLFLKKYFTMTIY